MVKISTAKLMNVWKSKPASSIPAKEVLKDIPTKIEETTSREEEKGNPEKTEKVEKAEKLEKTKDKRKKRNLNKRKKVKSKLPREKAAKEEIDKANSDQ